MQILRSQNKIIVAAGKVVKVIDNHAAAFLRQAKIDDPAMRIILENFVIDLKDNNLFLDFIALYPFYGGDANAHKLNLVNVNQYNLIFYGGLTHSGNGVKGDGSSGYADTGITPQLIGQNSVHISLYNRTSTNSTTNYIFGAQNVSSGTGENVLSVPCYLTNRMRVRINLPSTNYEDFQVDNYSGYWNYTRTSSNQSKIYRNELTLINSVLNSVSACNYNIYIFCINSTGTASLFSNKEFSLFTIGYGLSDVKSLALNNCVQRFMTARGIAV